jgi:hypothetical protein
MVRFSNGIHLIHKVNFVTLKVEDFDQSADWEKKQKDKKKRIKFVWILVTLSS